MSADRSRSGALAAWLRAWRAGLSSFDDVLARVTGDDEPHRVDGLPEGADQPLGQALLALRDSDPAVALVTAGDPRGLPGPGPLTSAALLAGEAVLGLTWALVPTVTTHGSGISSAATTCRWQAYAATPALPDPLDVPGAEQELADALREVTTELARLEVASWHPELAEGFRALRRASSAPQLPAQVDQRAHRLLAQADRLAQVLDLAALDAPGGAVTAQQARDRQLALAHLGTAVRRARMAAYNAPLPAATAHRQHGWPTSTVPGRGRQPRR